MKRFEDLNALKNLDLKGLVIEESPDSLLVTARKTLYVPEKKIILTNQMTERETQFIKETFHVKGGLIV